MRQIPIQRQRPTDGLTCRPTARAAARVGSSAVRDLLRLTTRPDVLSLAGGLPDPASLPVDAVRDATRRVLAEGPRALQYAPTEGDPHLRSWIAAQRAVSPDAVLVTHGSQQALDLVVRASVERGDEVVVADPAYPGAVQVLRLAEASIVPIPADAEGLDVDDLERRLGAGLRPKLVYTVSTFHNPTGAVMGANRRGRLAALAERFGFLIVDDDPYGALRWSGPPSVPLAAFTERVVTLGTFSKVLSPGLRVGYVAGPAPIIADLVIVKQAADLQTSTLNQGIVRELVSDHAFLDAHIGRLRQIYESRADALAQAIDDLLADRFTFSRALGGMFLWLTAVDDIDTNALLDLALVEGMAFVPGDAFAVGADLRRSLRLSFATLEPESLREAVVRLTRALDRVTA